MGEQVLKSYWPIIAYGGLVLATNIAILLISYYTGEKHKERDTGEIYESGITVTGDARVRFSVHFYLIAMFFVIFDVESLFIIAWAVVFKETGWAGWWGMFIFIMILFVVLFYEWKTGALDFGPKGKKILEAYKKMNRKEEKK